MHDLVSRATTEAEPRPSAAATPVRGAPSLALQRSLGNRVVARGGEALHEAARAGLRGGGGRLPHFDAIQRSFGAHDVRDVRAHVGAEAARASRALGAAAYTYGREVAFADATPSLRIAAHEAAHAVQQAAGVQLAGGVGAAGDRYERHADAVAERVVRGRSAEGLLSRFAARAGGAPTLQRAAFDCPSSPISQSTAVDYDEVAAQEIPVSGTGNITGNKTTRLTALLLPVKGFNAGGRPTKDGVDPLGWAWVKSNEVRTTHSNKLRFWVRFHLLNAELGGDGYNTAHLTPTDKSTNSQWDSDIEEPMKAKLKGKGALEDPKGVPLYYDARVTYWGRGDAPSTYDLSGSGGADYKDNITLFPKQIDAKWSAYEGIKWVAQPSATTGLISKPAGVGGSEVDLTSGMTKFSGLSSIYGIDEEIFGLLVDVVLPKGPKTYRDVRGILELWVAGASTPRGMASRSAKLFLADAKLRAALDGKGPLKLKLGGKAVPDDDTPEARSVSAAVRVPKTQEFSFQGRFGKQTEDPILAGYTRASKKKSPTVSEVLDEALATTLNRITLRQINSAWSFYLENNEVLPLMVGFDFASPGREVATVVFERTIKGLESEVSTRVGWKNQPTETDKIRSQVLTHIELGKGGGWFQRLYYQVLCEHGPLGVQDFLTVEHAAGRNDPMLYAMLLRHVPALEPIREGLARVEVVKKALLERFPIDRRVFPRLQRPPWETPLDVSIAATMVEDLESHLSKKRSMTDNQQLPSKKEKREVLDD